MKVRNKLAALFLTAAMAVSFTACGSEDDSKASQNSVSQEQGSEDESGGQNTAEVMAAAKEKMADIKSMNAKSIVEMDMKVSAEGQEQSMQTVTTMDMTCSYNPMLAKIDMSMDMGELGKQESSMYMEEADGEYNLYVSDGTSWQAQTVPALTATQYDAANNMSNYMDDSLQAAGTEKLDSGNAYKFTGTISGDKMKEVMNASGMMDSLSSYGVDASQIDSLLSDVGGISVTYWIDEATSYPVKYEIDETEVMNTLMSKAMESAEGQDASASIEFSKVTMQMTCSDFNAADAVTIPDEAKEAL